MRNKTKTLIIQVLLTLLFLFVWEIIGTSSPEKFFFIGSPSAVATSFIQLWKENLLDHFFTTGLEALLGLMIGTIIGSISGLALWYSKRLSIILRPFVIAIGTLPIFALAPLMIVWFGIGLGMKVILAAFSTVFVAFNQANKGALSVPVEYLETLKGMNASKKQIFRKVIVPSSIDWVLSSMRLNIGFSLLGAFIGEFIASDKGLGFLILRAAGLYNIPRALAAAIGITVLALLFDYFARYIEKHSHFLVQFLSVPRILRRKIN